LPFLQGYSLGQVCHVVQLAMSEKKLLGYLDGTIAPYQQSNSMMKATAAEHCRSSNASQRIPLATWECAQSCLAAVLESAVRKGKKQVPISTLKRLFRSRFHIELSETALGYTKLSDLLQDEAFIGMCSVKLLERGYVIIPDEAFAQNRPDLFKRVAPQAEEDAAFFLDEGSTDVGSGSFSPTLTASPAWSPCQQDESDTAFSWQMEDLCIEAHWGSMCCGETSVMDCNASICLAEPLLCGAHDQFSSSQVPWMSEDQAWPSVEFAFPAEVWRSENQVCHANWHVVAETACPAAGQVEPEYLSKRACEGAVVRNTFIEVDAGGLCSPRRARRCSQSVPRNFGCSIKETRDQTFVSRPSMAPTRLPNVNLHACSQAPGKCVLRLSEFF